MRYKFPYLNRYCLVTVFSIFYTCVQAAPFEQGDMGVSIMLGSGQAFNENYTLVGAGVSYYVVDGLSLGVDAEVWLGGSIAIDKVSPQVQYVFAREEKLKPFIGVFYRRMRIEGLKNLDSAGGRAGVYFSGQGNYYISAGLVHENYFSCDKAVYVSCSDTYPELTITFGL